jgi:hypothetical protein
VITRYQPDNRVSSLGHIDVADQWATSRLSLRVQNIQRALQTLAEVLDRQVESQFANRRLPTVRAHREYQSDLLRSLDRKDQVSSNRVPLRETW